MFFCYTSFQRNQSTFILFYLDSHVLIWKKNKKLQQVGETLWSCSKTICFIDFFICLFVSLHFLIFVYRNKSQILIFFNGMLNPALRIPTFFLLTWFSKQKRLFLEDKLNWLCLWHENICSKFRRLEFKLYEKRATSVYVGQLSIHYSLTSQTLKIAKSACRRSLVCLNPM